MKVRGEWPGVDRNFKIFDENGFYGFTDSQWNQILHLSYVIAETEYTFHPKKFEYSLLQLHKYPMKKIKLIMIIQSFKKIDKQFYLNGNRNLWIIKAPEACRGKGIRLLCRLLDILECEKGMGGRTVQKYVECPLLAPLHSSISGNVNITDNNLSPRSMPSTTYINNNNMTIKFKYDMRIWVLVTCYQPLQAYVFNNVYGRRCSAAYSNRVQHVTNDLIHLSNYSIQKHHTVDNNKNSLRNRNNNNNKNNNINAELDGSIVRDLDEIDIEYSECTYDGTNIDDVTDDRLDDDDDDVIVNEREEDGIDAIEDEEIDVEVEEKEDIPDLLNNNKLDTINKFIPTLRNLQHAYSNRCSLPSHHRRNSKKSKPHRLNSANKMKMTKEDLLLSFDEIISTLCDRYVRTSSALSILSLHIYIFLSIYNSFFLLFFS